MAHEFHHGHIKSKDPSKTARWWAETFGAKVLEERNIHGALFAPVEISGVVINISTPIEEERDKMSEGDAGLRYGFEHIGLLTDDLEADLARIAEQGLEIFDVRESPQAKIAFVETPDKVRVELIQRL